MIALVPTLIALIAVVVAFVIAIRARKSTASLVRTITVPPSAESTTRAIVHSIRLRMLAAVIIALLVALALSRLALGDDAVGAALAPGVGGALGLLALAASPFPRRVPEDGVRRADLTPRSHGALGPRWAVIVPLAAAAVLAVLLVVTGVSGSEVDGPFSRYIVVTVPQHGSSSAGPYPAWAYGLFILGGTILVVAAMLFALRRVATAPPIGQHDVVGLDAALRGTVARFILLSGTAVIVLYLGAVSLTAGSAAATASYWDYANPSFEARQLALCGHQTTCSFVVPATNTISGVTQPTHALGLIGAILGLVLIAMAIALALLALTSLTLRWSAEAAARPAKVDA